MKAKLIIGFLISLLLLSTVSAMLPMPISGQVVMQGYPAPTGLDLTIRSELFDISVPTRVDANGFFLFSLSNTAIDKGDVSITINICRHLPECTKTFTLMGKPIQDVNFNILSGSTVIVDGEEKFIENVIYSHICWNGDNVADPSQCPIAPPAQTQCSDGSLVDNQEDCPTGISDIWSWIIAALAIILGALGFSWSKGFMGLCKYWWKKGEEYEKEGDHYMAEKCKRRAVKMAKTAFEKATAKKYEKKI